MKSRIARKLSLYFLAVLLLFAIIIGSLFIALFRSHTIELHKADLQARALSIAATLATYMSGESQGVGNGQGGYGAYLRLIDEIAMTDVWIVDRDLSLITSGHTGSVAYNYADLPNDAEAVVETVFMGETTFSEGFSNLLNAPTITVGTPIVVSGIVAGALLLHTSVDNINQAAMQGVSILIISLCIALVLALLLSFFFAYAFTKPLHKMKLAASSLSLGDYDAKTGVAQDDEIGALADTIDGLGERLSIAKRESDALDNMRRDFISNISHELRTPVTVMRGYLEALSDEVVSDAGQVHAYHRQLLKESEFLMRLVNDLLELSRLQNAEFSIEMEELNLSNVIHDAIRSVRRMADGKGIRITERIDTDTIPFTGDYARLRQMFLIVLDNAIKFSHTGGSINVILSQHAVTIRDDGIGISEKDLPHIFERFYHERSEQNKSGTGLGLSIAKQIADRHGIAVNVESEESVGTAFAFVFPVN